VLICTISTANHLPKAACLAESLRKTQPDHLSILCLVERDRSKCQYFQSYFSRVVLASELGSPDFDSFIFPYPVLEACMAVKAQILLWAMREFPDEQQFVYLDSDIFVYSRFEELELRMRQAEIILTPHHVHDEDTFEGIWDNMLRTLLCGTFNSGFIAVQRSRAALEFLEWWDRKLRRFCYKDDSSGLYFEQKWLDIAPSFFDINVLREPGYNVANWNVSRRCLTTLGDSSGYLVHGRPLRFFHFSMVDSGRDLYYFKKYLDISSPVFAMRQKYLRDVDVLNTDGQSQVPWSYDYYLSGDLIATEVRNSYRSLPVLADMFPQPFGESDSALSSAEAIADKR
jgi:hypothetical protein